MKNNGKKMLNKSNVQNRPFYFTIKRITDICLSFLGVILLSPIFLIVAILVKLDGTHGKILYIQERIGKNDKPFKMYKFRSMNPNADKQVELLRKQSDVKGAMFKMKSDPRVTKVGKFIRKYSLDELPQLFNVIEGQMSLVGPRPPLPSEVKKYNDYDMQRLWVKPGCTGLWQVTDRNSTDFNGAVKLDVKYIRKSSFFYDLMIIFKTVKVMIKPNAAY